MFIIFGILFTVLGLSSLFFNVSHLPGMGGREIEYYSSIEDAFLYGSIQLSIGIVFILYGVYRNRKLNIFEFSKCPKCKESYTYSELKDGICPECNIKTIDINKYYEDK